MPSKPEDLGEYWIGRSPRADGWSVFWTPAQRPEWHCCLATFASRERAESYMQVEYDIVHAENQHPPEAAITELLPEPPPPRLIAATLPASFSEFARAARPKLLAILPVRAGASPLGGMTSEEVRRVLETTYDKATALCRMLHANGEAQWLDNGERKILMPPGAHLPLTDKACRGTNAVRVHRVLAKSANKDGVIAMSMAEIGRAAGIKPGSVSMAIWDLQSRNAVMLARPGSPKACAVYQVLKQPEQANAAPV